jgi:hypothetical protein
MGRVAGNKKLFVLIAALITVAVVVAFFTYYRQQAVNLVRIKEFFKSGGGQAEEVLIFKFTVKVENQGVNDVTGLIVAVKVLGNGSELAQDAHLLHPNRLLSGEVREDSDFAMMININDTVGNALSAIAWIELNGAVLDQTNLSLQ